MFDKKYENGMAEATVMGMVQPYIQEHATIYGHGVWHYMISATIGNIHIVEYEGKGMALEGTTLILADNQKAERLFKKYCNGILSGKFI